MESEQIDFEAIRHNYTARSPAQRQTLLQASRKPYVRPVSVYARFQTGEYGAIIVPPMPRDEALTIMHAMASDSAWSDKEVNHVIADELLLQLLGDAEISDAFNDVGRWYA